MKLMRPLCPNGIDQPTWRKERLSELYSSVNKSKPAVVLIVLSSVNVDTYNRVKLDLLKAGVPGQVVVKE